MDRRRFLITATMALVASSAAASILVEAGRGDLHPDDLWSLPWLVLPLVFVAAGAGILWNRPRNAVGRLLLIPALAWVPDPLVSLRLAAFDPARDSLDAGLFLALAVDNLSWLALIYPVFHLMLVYPTGRLLSRRWRALVVLEAVMVAILTVGFFASERIGPIPENGRGAWTVANPFGIVAGDVFESRWFTLGWPAGLVTLTLAGFLCVALRYRRSGDVERHQIKWLLGSAGVFGAVYVGLAAWSVEDGPAELALGLALDLIPIAVMTAVLRYRLFEIDRLISRTVGYALVAALVAAVYTGCVLAVSAIVPASANELAVATSTLAAFVAIRPLRRATRGWVDRRFDRTRYDAAATVEQTAVRLSNRLDLHEVLATVSDVTRVSLQPSEVMIWLKPPPVDAGTGRDRPAHTGVERVSDAG